MKYRTLLIFYLLSPVYLFSQTPTTTRNFIVETSVKVAGKKTASSLAGLPVDSANRIIKYIDGLGRPLQVVQWQGSPAKKDIVNHIVYDAMGIEAIKYLPYAEQTSSDGSFKTNAINAASTYYGAGSWDANVPKTPFPFAQTVFENSPLNRIVEQGQAGAVWQPFNSNIPNSGHTVKTERATNSTNEVLLWKKTGSTVSAAAYYLPNRLYKTISKGENWTSGKAGTMEEFKDLEDRLILQRVWETENVSLSTYYVYDDFSNLCYVVPPAVNVTSFNESDVVFKDFVYGYHFDGRKRIVEKKIPGKGWEFIVHNKLDQIVLTQDSIQRANNKWSFIKYDAMGRIIMNGVVNSSLGRTAWQSDIDGQAHLWEGRDNLNGNGTGTGFTNISLPSTGISEYGIINYYDDYDFYNNSFGLPSSPLANSSRTRGLLTGSRINIIGTGTMLLSVSYYNEDGRVAESRSQNHLGGSDIIQNTFDFSGGITASIRTHQANNVTTVIDNHFIIDHMGRKISTKQNINYQGEVVLNKSDYNEIGQLKQKSLHSTNGGSSFLQSTKYAYNERGWMKNSVSPEFNLKLGYDTTGNPQYNGNISTQLWGSSYGNQFLYTYDKLNRLTNGTTVSGIGMSEIITYDVMGNINTLSRDGSSANQYFYNGNKLSSINGIASGYIYDGNGNATTDGRNSAAFTYNRLNLPNTIVKTGANIAYTYDATGDKLKKVSNTSSVTTSDYIDGINYVNGAIETIRTEEGLARNNSGSYVFEYNLKDHLGNVRYTFNKHPLTGAVQKLQEDNYYAFGLRKVASGGTNKYLYSGKEIQEELEQYDFGSRFYDPITARWNVIDNKAEKYYSATQYGYAGNNPVLYVDFDGQDYGISVDSKNKTITIKQVFYTDGREMTNSKTQKAAAYFNELSGKYGLQTKDGTYKINYEVTVVESGKYENYKQAIKDDVANAISTDIGSPVMLNIFRDIAITERGGDDIVLSSNDKVDVGVVVHEMMHSQGASHNAIGRQGKIANIETVGATLNYASDNNDKGLKIKAKNSASSNKLKVEKENMPKVKVENKEKINLSGIIIAL